MGHLGFSLKTSASILFAIGLCANFAFAKSLPSSMSVAGTDPRVAPEINELVFSNAILLDENQEPVCIASIAGRKDLTPRFAAVASADF